MKQLFLAITIALFSCTGFTQPIKVAIMETVPGSEGISPMILNMVRAEIQSSITNESGYSAVERVELDEAIKEIKFQQSGMVDDDKIVELGKMNGADYVCISKMSKDGQTYYIEASLINVKTSKIEISKTAFITGGGIPIINQASKGIALDLMGKENDSNGIYGLSYEEDESKGNSTERTSADKPVFPIVYAHDKILYNITSCKQEGNIITIEGLVQNNSGISANIGLIRKPAAGAVHCNIYTKAGHKIDNSYIKFGNGHCGYYYSQIYQNVPNGVTIMFYYEFKNVPANTKLISAFSFKTCYYNDGNRAKCKDHTINNIPVTK